MDRLFISSSVARGGKIAHRKLVFKKRAARLMLGLGASLLFVIMAVTQLNQDETAAPSIEPVAGVGDAGMATKQYVYANIPSKMIVTASSTTGKTFSGTEARHGVCAVDPSYLPLGTSLFVEGYGYCKAEDTGAEIKGNQVGVFLADSGEAEEFGSQERKVWVLNGLDGVWIFEDK